MITDYESPRGNRMVGDIPATPVHVFAGRAGAEDENNHRRFKLIDRDSFLEDVYESTAWDFRKYDISKDPKVVTYVYPVMKKNPYIIVDLYYIDNLEVARVIYDTDGKTLLASAVTEGPHMNLMVTGDAAFKKAFLDKIDKFFKIDGTMKQDRTKAEKDETKRLQAAGKSKTQPIRGV